MVILCSFAHHVSHLPVNKALLRETNGLHKPLIRDPGYFLWGAPLDGMAAVGISQWYGSLGVFFSKNPNSKSHPGPMTHPWDWHIYRCFNGKIYGKCRVNIPYMDGMGMKQHHYLANMCLEYLGVAP